MALIFRISSILIILLATSPSFAWSTNEKMSCQYGNGSNSRQCLLCNCVFETIGESTPGKLAVANTVFTRVHSDTHPINGGPDTVCGVIYDRSQYSWTKNKSTIRNMKDVLNLKDPLSQKKLTDCVNVTDAALKYPPKKGPLWYHADYVKPAWAPKLRRVAKIGTHIFYTDPKKPQMSFDNKPVQKYLTALQSKSAATIKKMSAPAPYTPAQSKPRKAAQ